MKFLKMALVLLLISTVALAGDFGIYEKVVEKAKGEPADIAAAIAQKLTESGFKFLNTLQMNTPNLVRQNSQNHSYYRAFLVLATSEQFDRFLANFGTRYAANWILRIGIFENEAGTHVVMANPVTLTRIICNDLKGEDYAKVVAEAEKIRENLRKAISLAVEGTMVSKQMPPLRSEDRLRNAKKDMLMMVGPMTYFRDKNQFPILMEFDAGPDAANKLKQVLSKVKQNIDKFQPDEDDAGYHWTKNPDEDLKWHVVAEAQFDGVNAAVLGITRNRTEALSFHICGMKRESDTNTTPGIDHVCAYPIEVAIFEEDGKIKVGTAREMFRMDMFFWDAGKWAFMKFMNMPKMLDNSIRKAITGE